MLKSSKKVAKNAKSKKEVDKKSSFPATTSNFSPSLKKDSQYFQNLVTIYRNDSTKYQEYGHLCYFSQTFSVGDCVLVDNSDSEDVGQITKIMKIATEEVFLLLVEVQW